MRAPEPVLEGNGAGEDEPGVDWWGNGDPSPPSLDLICLIRTRIKTELKPLPLAGLADRAVAIRSLAQFPAWVPTLKCVRAAATFLLSSAKASVLAW